MKITSLEVEGAGRFSAPITVEGFGDGLNILAAGNEAGKSTLFKAIRFCLFERHTTTNRLVTRLCSEGFNLPLRVKLGFKVGQNEYVICKNFIRSPSASFCKDGAEISRGRQADEDLWEVLGIRPGAGRAVDEASFGLLWVGQGASFEPPSPTGAAADALNAIIQQEVGALIGGERARDVVKTIETELDAQLTSAGRPKASGRLSKAVAEAERLVTRLADVRARLLAADGDLDALSEKYLLRKNANDSQTLVTMRSELKTAEEDLRVARDARARLIEVRTRERTAHAAVDKAERLLSEATGRASFIDRSRQRETEIIADLDPIISAASSAEEKILTARAESLELRDRTQRIVATESEIALTLNALVKQDKRDATRSRIEILSAISQRVGSAEVALAGHLATTSLMQEVDVIEREIGILDGRLKSSASKITIELCNADVRDVLIDGAVAKTSTTRAVVAPVVVRIGEIATVTASPPATFGAEEIASREKLADRLRAILLQTATTSATHFREVHARRKALESELAALATELKLAGTARGDLAREIERMEGDLAESDQAINSVLSLVQKGKLPEENEVRRRQDALLVEKDAAIKDRERLEDQVLAQNMLLNEKAEDIGRLRGELGEIQRARELELALLPDAERVATLTTLREQCEAAKHEHQTCSAAFFALQVDTPDEAQIEGKEMRCSRLRLSIENQRDESARIDREIAKLEGRVIAIGAEGLGDTAAEISEEIEITTREADDLRARIDMLILLRDTIERCHREQRGRLNAPIMKHLQPFLGDLFGSATLELGDSFTIVGLKRAGPAIERFDLLSDGTREQIAVLTRLAMGSMMCERGDSIPIILDDALVFSDDNRIESMFDALNRAAARQQVIVLTCRMKTFATLGGRRLAIAR